MARNEPEVVACEDCGCLNERATVLLAERDQTIEDLEKELRGKRAKITRLETEKHDKLIASKRAPAAREVLKHWMEVCAPNAKEPYSDERLAAVIARLNGGHSVEELKLCATGYSKVPYVTDSGRSANGTPKQWNADAELIYRTPEHVRRGIAYAAATVPQSGSAPSASSVERLSWLSVQYANRRLILRALTERFGKPVDDDPALRGWLRSPCPRCDKPVESPWTGKALHPLSLSIAPPGHTFIVRCDVCGLDELRLIAAITEDKN